MTTQAVEFLRNVTNSNTDIPRDFAKSLTRVLHDYAAYKEDRNESAARYALATFKDFVAMQIDWLEDDINLTTWSTKK